MKIVTWNVKSESGDEYNGIFKTDTAHVDELISKVVANELRGEIEGWLESDEQFDEMFDAEEYGELLDAAYLHPNTVVMDIDAARLYPDAIGMGIDDVPQEELSEVK